MGHLLGLLGSVLLLTVSGNINDVPVAPAEMTVVVVDDSSVVQAETGLAYANEIASAISTIPDVSVIQKWVNDDWTLEQNPVALDTDLIVIHVNAFSIRTSDADGYTRLIAFVQQFETKRTRFLLYSRSPYIDVPHVSRSLIDDFSRDTGLSPDRFDTFSLEYEGSDRIETERLERKVRRLLEL